MIKRGMTAVFGLGLLLVQGQGLAASEEQLNVIKRLGELNGIALHCKALPETQRMKRELVKNLPKRKELGDLFDMESNNSFMAFITKGAVCPSPGELSQQVDTALEELEKVYSKK